MTLKFDQVFVEIIQYLVLQVSRPVAGQIQIGKLLFAPGHSLFIPVHVMIDLLPVIPVKSRFFRIGQKFLLKVHINSLSNLIDLVYPLGMPSPFKTGF